MILFVMLIGVLAGFSFPWWIIPIGFIGLAFLYFEFRRRDSDMQSMYLYCGIAIFVGLCIGCGMDVLLPVSHVLKL